MTNIHSVNKGYVSTADEMNLSSADLAALLEAVLGRKASFRFKAKGWSMLPFIRDGDNITISPPGDLVIGTGKVVAFKYSETKKLIVHRVIGRSRAGYLLQGDRLSKPDGFISRENILGVVTRVERGGKEPFWGSGFERHSLAFFSRMNIFFLLLEMWRLIPSSIRSFWRHA